MVYLGSLTNFDLVYAWTQDKCVPLVREITFENGEVRTFCFFYLSTFSCNFQSLLSKTNFLFLYHPHIPKFDFRPVSKPSVLETFVYQLTLFHAKSISFLYFLTLGSDLGKKKKWANQEQISGKVIDIINKCGAHVDSIQEMYDVMCRCMKEGCRHRTSALGMSLKFIPLCLPILKKIRDLENFVSYSQ